MKIERHWTEPDMTLNIKYNKLVADIKDRIITSCNLAQENIENAGQLQRCYANKWWKLVTLKPDEEVLVIQFDNNKLLTCWQDPFTTVWCISNFDKFRCISKFLWFIFTFPYNFRCLKYKYYVLCRVIKKIFTLLDIIAGN